MDACSENTERRDLSLVDWQRQNLAALRESAFLSPTVLNVTVVAYHFRPPNLLDADFWRTEFALLQTFKTQGRIPAVLVVNEATDKIAAFCRHYGVDLQIEKSLIPGRIKTLAIDLVVNLHRRFSTDYVLVVQDDGFPLRPGLVEFVGKFDYVGAPWERHMTLFDVYPEKYRVGNGGFSLRSKRLCEEASRLYHRWFRMMPYWWYLLGDDTFYCKTLRFWFPAYRRAFRWATPAEAARFSVENCHGEISADGLPLGFHGIAGWCNVLKATMSPDQPIHLFCR